MRRLLAGLALLVVATLVVVFVERRALAPRFAAVFMPPPAPTAPPELDPGVHWSGSGSDSDDWYTLERLDPHTIAIGEPRSPERNVSYLLLGDDRALLFDTGGGYADLKPVVDDLTDLPVTALPSHLHYDHMGSIARFESVALPDLPALRAQAVNGVLVPTYRQFLGVMEDVEPPEVRPTEWWAPDQEIELGGRRLVLRHTPGHTPESVSLWDPDRGWMFSGDYLTPGDLYAFLPGSSLSDYRRTARSLLSVLPDDTVLWGAHDERSDTLAPQLARADLRALGDVLEAIERGEAQASGLFPRVYAVNDRISLWADIGDR